MATFPKIADNEMNYYQFKARQMLLLKKEDREWQEFCKQVAPECTACLSESTILKDSKDIGIQTNPRPSLKKFEKPVLRTTKKDELIPEALNSIRNKLENIDLALSKIYNVQEESKQKKQQEDVSCLKNGIKSFEERRRLLIQNSLKTSLEKLPTFASKITKKPPTIQPKNTSYFLPHDLQVKRAASRKAYLASLQTKPKVSFQKDKIIKKTTQHIQNKRAVTEPAPKSGKNTIGRKVLSNIGKEETLISIENDEAKDENIEFIVEAILDDLLGETALDLNKIKQKKRDREFKIKQKTLEKETGALSGLLNSSSAKNTNPKVLASSDNRSLEKLKSFLAISKKLDESTAQKINLCAEESMRKKSIFFSEKLNDVPDEPSSGKKDADTLQPSQFYNTKIFPKFLCDVSHTITIDSRKAKDIAENKDIYWRYLKNISRTVKGNFNPWILNNMLAESVLDDCINDIAEELSNVPSTFVQELYNQEFVQQVRE